MTQGVLDSSELARIRRLPRRVWTEAQAQEAVQRLTGALRTPNGTETLRPVQAVALVEAAQYRGLLAPVRVGGGKTLISLLAPRVVPCARPLLLLPASLVQKTEHEAQAYRRNWQLHPFNKIESYQTLGRVGAARFLEAYQPDLIVCDEGHYLKNTSAAVTKRLARYLREARKAGRRVTLVVMSGTIMNRSIRDFAHLGTWTLGDLSPLPAEWPVADEWSRALDAKIADHRRLAPGALSQLMVPGETVRSAFRRRLIETPGVVATQEPPLDIPLTIRSVQTPDCPETEDAFRTLRSEATTPDGWPCMEAVEVWRHARELASGYFYIWSPRPPKEWSEARSAWYRACRVVLSDNRRGLDSEHAVALATKEGQYPELLSLLNEWLRVRHTFRPNTVPVWVSDLAVRQILAWAKESPGIVWISSQGLAARLQDEGLRYFGEGAVDQQGNGIGQTRPSDGSIVASIDACSIGQNLQAWSRNLVVDVPPNGKRWEQLLGRTHRPGQTRPVDVTVLFGCREDVRAFWQGVEDAGAAEEMTGQAQKLVHADTSDVSELDEVPGWHGARWDKNATGKVKGYWKDE